MKKKRHQGRAQLEHSRSRAKYYGRYIFRCERVLDGVMTEDVPGCERRCRPSNALVRRAIEPSRVTQKLQTRG